MTQPTTPTAAMPVIRLTDAARAQFARLLAAAPAGAAGLRLSTPQKGCSGFSYAVAYAEQPTDGDTAIDTGAGQLLIDGNSVPYVAGTVMDWQDDDFQPGFVFHNPNASGSCGCGDSFTINPASTPAAPRAPAES